MIRWLRDAVGDLAWWVEGQSLPESRAFDRAWGTDTAGFDLWNYEPSHPEVVDDVLDAAGIEPGGWSFVDLGSGKGRAVLLASQRPFRVAAGVEHRDALHRVAVANGLAFESRGGARCPLAFTCGDAAEAPLPEGPLFVYLYNPFPANVLGRVLDRLAGRPILVGYVNPREAPLLEARGFRVRAAADDGVWKTWRVYAPP